MGNLITYRSPGDDSFHVLSVPIREVAAAQRIVMKTEVSFPDRTRGTLSGAGMSADNPLEVCFFILRKILLFLFMICCLRLIFLFMIYCLRPLLLFIYRVLSLRYLLFIFFLQVSDDSFTDRGSGENQANSEFPGSSHCPESSVPVDGLAQLRVAEPPRDLSAAGPSRSAPSRAASSSPVRRRHLPLARRARRFTSHYPRSVCYCLHAYCVAYVHFSSS